MSKVMSTSEMRKLLADQKTALESEIEALKTKATPLRKERDDLQEKIEPLTVRIHQLNAQLKTIEQPHLGKLMMQLNAINKALDDKTMQPEGEAA